MPSRVTTGGILRHVNECSESHRFTTRNCPVCEPDELQIKRLEREYEREQDLRHLVEGSTFFVPEPLIEDDVLVELIDKLRTQTA